MQIEFAYNTEKKCVFPTEAQKGKEYFCPKCSEPLIVKQGNIRVHHFAHKADTNCTGYTLLHLGCIRALSTNLYYLSECQEQEDWAVIYDVCKRCKQLHNRRAIHPFKYNNVKIEYTIPSSLYKADIALLENNNLKGIIEVCNTHAINQEKLEFLNNNQIPFIEVCAKTIREQPSDTLRLPVIRSNVENIRGQFRREICEICRQPQPV